VPKALATLTATLRQILAVGLLMVELLVAGGEAFWGNPGKYKVFCSRWDHDG